ncbi:enamelin [Sarcophilus harrisii]|uniref:enamelin n=1 Tax=Sarcophilus harrisii TaxID=9305 RepID=UPI0002271E49|nr:enamelin [Sarcophilus harrisii]
MLLLQGNHGAFSPELDDVVPRGKMKTLLMFLSLFSCSIAMPMHMPRMGGFGSKSEEMMRYGQYNFMNTPQMAHFSPLYGYNIRLAQQFPQLQMPMWPQPPPNTWLPQQPIPPNIPRPQMKAGEGQETSTTSQPLPTKSMIPTIPTKPAVKKSPEGPPRQKEEDEQPPQYPPFGNGMFPFPQPPWQFPQGIPPGFGRPPVSNEEGGNPYFGYFGYHGFGGRTPYYSEEMFEQDFEKPKEEDPPKVESTTSAPPANTTVLENNSTQPTIPSPGGSQGGNDTSPTGNEAQAQNPGNNQGVYPGVNLAPSVNVSSYDVPGSQIPQVLNQPNVFENSPNPNFRSFPVNRQWSQTGLPLGPRINVPFYRNYPNQRIFPWHNLAYVSKQIARPGNTAYRKVYPVIPKSNSPNQVSNAANNRKKPQSPTKNPEETNGGSADPKHDTVHRDEQTQNPKENPVTEKERTTFPTRIPTSTWRNSQGYETNKSNYKLPPPEGNPPIPSVNSVDQHENSYYPRVDSRFPAGIQIPNFPKGIISEPRKDPSDAETNPPEMKQGTHQPPYAEEDPYLPREPFFPAANTWNPQQGAPVFEDEPLRQEGPLLYPAFGVRGNVPYPEYIPYDPRGNSPYARGSMWDERDDFPGTFRPTGKAGNPSYSPNTPPSQRRPSTNNEEDPIDQTGDEIYRRPNAWGKESNFKESQVRYREKYLYAPGRPSEPKDYPQHSTDNLLKQRNSPYGEFYPWHPEYIPSYNMAPPLTPPGENNGYYYPANAFEQEERESWDQKNYVPAQKGRVPYYSRNFWGLATSLQKSTANSLSQREDQPLSSNFPVGLRGNPTYQEAESHNYGSEQINRVNLSDKGQLAVTESVIPNSPVNQEEADSYPPASQRNPCCASDPAGFKDIPFVPLDYFPPFGLVSEGERNSFYTESSHTKHARHIIYPPGIQSNQRNSSEKYLPEKEENPDAFRDDSFTLKKNTPCSKRNEVEQTGSRVFSEADSLQANTPCFKSHLRGDGNDVLTKIFGTGQFDERTNNLIPEELEAPKESPRPENIESEGGGSEGRMKQKGVPIIQQVPCLHSKLEKHFPSSTGPPLDKRRPDLSDGEPEMVSAQPSSTLNGLAAREQLSGTNIDPYIASEPPLSFPSFPKEIPRNAELQVPDCLLLQS